MLLNTGSVEGRATAISNNHIMRCYVPQAFDVTFTQPGCVHSCSVHSSHWKSSRHAGHLQNQACTIKRSRASPSYEKSSQFLCHWVDRQHVSSWMQGNPKTHAFTTRPHPI
jgi:hypothetical protein